MATTALLVVGCAGFVDGIKKTTNKGIDVVATVAKAPISLLDVATPIVQDPNDPTAKAVNPNLVAAAQSAATTFGGAYGGVISTMIALGAGVAGTLLTQAARRKIAAPPPGPIK